MTRMNVTRRDFLKISGVGVSGAALGGLGLRGTSMAGARGGNTAIKYSRESTSICPFCAEIGRASCRERV